MLVGGKGAQVEAVAIGGSVADAAAAPVPPVGIWAANRQTLLAGSGWRVRGECEGRVVVRVSINKASSHHRRPPGSSPGRRSRLARERTRASRRGNCPAAPSAGPCRATGCPPFGPARRSSRFALVSIASTHAATDSPEDLRREFAAKLDVVNNHSEAIKKDLGNPVLYL